MVAAHAPLARSAAVSSANQFAVRMPGFGMVFDTATQAPAYACDALLGLQTTDEDTSLVARADGSYLLGSLDSGLRVVAADGCTWRNAAGWPSGVGVAAAAVVTGQPETMFAVTHQSSPQLYRSDDGGETWQLNIDLDTGESITGLRAVAGADDVHVYITRPRATSTLLLRSSDNGQTFVSQEYGSALTLLEVRAGDPDTLWLSSPRPASADVAIIRGAPDSTLTDVRHRVRFFGGLALDADGDSVWIADEAGALVRSLNGGDTFEAVYTTLAIACLIHTDDRLWACTAGSNQERALAYSDDGGESFQDAFAFAAVTRMVTCDPGVPVADTCAGAWNEWRADVLPRPAPIDGGSDAATTSDASTTDAAITPRSPTTCGCSMLGSQTPSLTTAWMLGLAFALSWRVRTWRISRMRSSRRARH